MMHFSLRHSLPMLAAFLLLSQILAGCSGFGPSKPAIRDDMKLTVAIQALSTTYLADYVALEKGYFKAQGLTINPIPFKTIAASTQMVEAVRSGSIDLCLGGLVNDAFLYTRIDSDVRVISQIQSAYSADLIAGNDLATETGLNENSPIEAKVRALIGKRIGVVSATGGTGAFMIYLFRQYGLDVNKVTTLVNLGGSSATAINALKTHKVDALSFFPPTGVAAEAQNVGHLWISPARDDIPQMVGQLNGVIYGKKSLIDAKPNTIKALIRAIATALTFIHEHPDEAARILQKYTHLDDKTTAAAIAIIQPSYPTSPIVDRKAYDTATDFDVKAGIIAIAPTFKLLVYTDIMEEALQDFTPAL